MNLRKMQEKGVEISSFLSETFFVEEDGYRMHGSARCANLRQDGAKMAPGAASLSAELCSVCWYDSLSDESFELSGVVDRLEYAEWCVTKAEGDPLGEGFTYLAQALEGLPSHSRAEAWRKSVREKAHALVSVSPQGGGVLVVADFLRKKLSVVHEVSAGWMRGNQIMVFRVSEEILSCALAELSALAEGEMAYMDAQEASSPDEPSWRRWWSGALLPGENTEAVLETALGLWDPTSETLWDIADAVETARLALA